LKRKWKMPPCMKRLVSMVTSRKTASQRPATIFDWRKALLKAPIAAGSQNQ